MANMLCARVRGLIVRHSLFVVAECCCCCRFHATQYDMMISCARVRYVIVAVVRCDVSSCACARGLVIVAVARRNMKMPCACARGLVIDIRHRHCRSCCRCCRRATQRECKASTTTSLSSSPLFLSLSPLCDATCCRAFAHEALSPSPPCDATCCCALGHWRPRGGHCPLRNECRGVSQADAGAGIRLAGVVTPRKRNKAARNQDNRRKKRWATFRMTKLSRPRWVSSAPKGRPRRRRPRDGRHWPRRRAARPSGREPKPRQSRRSTRKSGRPRDRRQCP
jgi:hypothetical protein